jgi:Lrp/AsnC family transcriptional regulator, regulator for asnA, asnC and gidA
MTQSTPATSSAVLDALDQRIVNLLKEDGRMAFTDISKQLSIPEATVRYRVQRLLQSGVVQIRARLNPQKLGMPHIVTMRLNVERDRITQVAETLTKLPEIQFVAIVTGHYNIIMDAHFGRHDDLLLLFDKIHAIPGIIHYDSCTILKLLKAEYQYTFI